MTSLRLAEGFCDNTVINLDSTVLSRASFAQCLPLRITLCLNYHGSSALQIGRTTSRTRTWGRGSELSLDTQRVMAKSTAPSREWATRSARKRYIREHLNGHRHTGVHVCCMGVLIHAGHGGCLVGERGNDVLQCCADWEIRAQELQQWGILNESAKRLASWTSAGRRPC